MNGVPAFVPHPDLLLDVGSGNGAGLLALKAELGISARIISCDDNRCCLEKAQDRLCGCGIPVNLVTRLKQSGGDEFYHLCEAVILAC